MIQDTNVILFFFLFMQMKNIFLYERLVQVDSWRKVDQAACCLIPTERWSLVAHIVYP